MLPPPVSKRSVTTSSVSGPQPTRARQVNDRPSHSWSAVKGSHRRTLMRPVILSRTPGVSGVPSAMAWVRYRATGSSRPASMPRSNRGAECGVRNPTTVGEWSTSSPWGSWPG